MPQSYGTIKKDDQVILDKILIWYEISKDPRSGLNRWFGSFELPDLAKIELGTYNLKLSNGKSGKIIIDRIESAGAVIVGRFTGTGPLK